MAEFSKKELHDMFMELMLPEFKTREEVLAHAKKKIFQEITDSGLSLDEIAQHYHDIASDGIGEEGIEEQLKGQKPLTYGVFADLHSILGKYMDTCFPYDPNIPDSKYLELRHRLFGGKPETDEPDSTGRSFAIFYLQEKFFED